MWPSVGIFTLTQQDVIDVPADQDTTRGDILQLLTWAMAAMAMGQHWTTCKIGHQSHSRIEVVVLGSAHFEYRFPTQPLRNSVSLSPKHF